MVAKELSEWESLQFHGEDPFCAGFVSSIYTVRLRKVVFLFFMLSPQFVWCLSIIFSPQFKHRHEIALVRHKLSTEYRLADNMDVFFGFAHSLFVDYRYADYFSWLRFSILALEILILTASI